MSERKECPQCHGNGGHHTVLRDLGGRTGNGMGVTHYVSCDLCACKGYTDHTDTARYLRSMGVRS